MMGEEERKRASRRWSSSSSDFLPSLSSFFAVMTPLFSSFSHSPPREVGSIYPRPQLNSDQICSSRRKKRRRSRASTSLASISPISRFLPSPPQPVSTTPSASQILATKISERTKVYQSRLTIVYKLEERFYREGRGRREGNEAQPGRVCLKRLG